MAGRYVFLFPPEHQAVLAAGIPNARLEIIETVGYNTPSVQPAEVLGVIRDFLAECLCPSFGTGIIHFINPAN